MDVLQFSFYLEKTKSAQQYRGMSVSLTAANLKKIGVLCSWYSVLPDSDGSPHTFTLEQVEESHVFLPVNLYVCTLSRGCFSDLGHAADTDGEASVMNLNQAKLDLATTQSLKLTEAAKSFICNLLKSIDHGRRKQGGAGGRGPPIRRM